MAKISLYMDEDSMSHSLLRAIRARGVDVTTAFEEGMIEREDGEHLEYATAQGRTLYTFNVVDFHRLHKSYLIQGKNHGGIILAPQQGYSIGEQMRRLLKLVATKTAEEMRNSVEFLSAWE